MNANMKVITLQRSNIQRKTQTETETESEQQQKQQEEFRFRQNRPQHQQQRQYQSRLQPSIIARDRNKEMLNINTKIDDQELQQEEQAILINEINYGNQYDDNEINYYDDDDNQFQIASLNENSLQPIQRTIEEEQRILKYFQTQMENQQEQKYNENKNTQSNRGNQNYKQRKQRITPQELIKSVYSNVQNKKLQNVQRILQNYGESEFAQWIDQCNFDNSSRNKFETLLDLHNLLVVSRDAGNMFYVKEIWQSQSMLQELQKTFDVHSYNHTSDKIINFYQQLLDSFEMVVELDPKQEYLPFSQTKKQIKILLKRNDHDDEGLQRYSSYNYFNKISKLETRIAQMEQQQLEFQIQKEKQWIKDQEKLAMNKRILKMAGVNITYKYCPSNIDMEDLMMREDDHPAFGDIIPVSQKEGYYSVPLYFNNNFYLLREDYLRDFRKSIRSVLKYGLQDIESQQLSQNFNVYKNLKVKRVKISVINGFRFKIQLQTLNDRNVDWKCSTRLMAGSLLYIVYMEDHYRNLELSIISRETDYYSNEAVIWVNVINQRLSFDVINFILEIQQTKRVYIFENKIFYESYIHYLNCIKDKDGDDFPFIDQLVLGSNNSVKPRYHKNDDYYYSMDFNTTDNTLQKPIVSIYKPWPSDLKTTLDDSQLKAVQQILTNGISLIQGPPGTGKTYCGALALKNLMNNKPNRQKSILIVCYTNHALDQFLNHMLGFVDIEQMVRVGGRCQDKKISDCRLQLVTKVNPNLNWEFFKEKDYVSKGINCYFGLPPMDEEEIMKYMERKLRRATKMGRQYDSQWALDSDEEKDRRSYLDNDDDDDPQDFRPPRVDGHVKLDKSDYYNLYNKLGRAKEYKIDGDIQYMNTKRIIGLTVTGCAKYAQLLKQINYDTLVIEEAAEVLECHTAAILSSQVEHLILIGDHLQLKPKLESYYLETKYQTNISLFERLVNNNYPCVTLTHQRRMKSKFADFIRLIYGENYKDHQEVIDKKNNIQIKGLEDDLMFFDHEYEEDKEEGRSKSNTQEAQMITNLVEYLVQNNHPPQSITVLGMYIKQLILIKQMLKQKSIEEVIVKSVDDYQGEENDIIILSLVRSNKEGKLGFTAIDNRICVALSRVRLGLYVFGNFTFIYESIKEGLLKQNGKISDLWLRIIDLAKQKGVLKTQFQLICQNHNNISKISNLNDWKITNFGGCTINCNQFLDCGHKCLLKCHSIERHERKYCTQQCKNTFDCGHQCQKLCKEGCGSCLYKVEKQVPYCGHNVTIECSSHPSTSDCKVKNVKLLDCGHSYLLTCYEIQNDIENICKEKVLKKLECGHEKQVFCSDSQKRFLCEQMVKKTFFDCQHTLDIECYKSKVFNCTELILIPQECGHNTQIECHRFKTLGHSNYDQLECSDPLKKCKIILECGHQCTGQCKKPCPPCHQFMTESKCGHKCPNKLVLCCQKDEYKCEHPLDNIILKCGHPMLCYKQQKNQDNYLCEQIVQIQSCQHQADIHCFEQKTYKCQEKTKKILKCGHSYSQRCSEDENSIVCKYLIQKGVPCGHNKTISVECASGLCRFPRIVTFNYCNHDVIIPCFQFNNQITCDQCVDPIQKQLNCGHDIMIAANKKQNQGNCEYVLKAKLDCGHMQYATCSEVQNNSVMCLFQIQMLNEWNAKNYCCYQSKKLKKHSFTKAKYLKEKYKFQFENGVNYFIKEICEKRFDCGHLCQSYFWECHCMGAHGTCIQCSESANQIYGQLYKNFEPEDYIIGVYSDLEEQDIPQTLIEAIKFQINCYDYILAFGKKQFSNPQIQKLKDNIFMVVSANQLLNKTLNSERISNFANKYQLFMNLNENDVQYTSLLQNSANYSSRCD